MQQSAHRTSLNVTSNNNYSAIASSNIFFLLFASFPRNPKQTSTLSLATVMWDGTFSFSIPFFIHSSSLGIQSRRWISCFDFREYSFVFMVMLLGNIFWSLAFHLVFSLSIYLFIYLFIFISVFPLPPSSSFFIFISKTEIIVTFYISLCVFLFHLIFYVLQFHGIFVACSKSITVFAVYYFYLSIYYSFFYLFLLFPLCLSFHFPRLISEKKLLTFFFFF